MIFTFFLQVAAMETTSSDLNAQSKEIETLSKQWQDILERKSKSIGPSRLGRDKIDTLRRTRSFASSTSFVEALKDYHKSRSTSPKPKPASVGLKPHK